MEEIDQSVSRGTTGKFEVIMDHFEVGELFLKTDFRLLVETKQLRNHNFFVTNFKITSDLSVVFACILKDLSVFTNLLCWNHEISLLMSTGSRFSKVSKREIALTLAWKTNENFENIQILILLEEIEKSVSRGTTGKLEGKLDSFRSWWKFSQNWF